MILREKEYLKLGKVARLVNSQCYVQYPGGKRTLEISDYLFSHRGKFKSSGHMVSLEGGKQLPVGILYQKL